MGSPRRGRGSGVLLAVIVAVPVSACSRSDFTAADLCTQYTEASQRAQEIRDLDPAQASVQRLRQDLKEFQASLDQLQAAGDGRLDTAISNLRSAVKNYVEAAVDAGKRARDSAQPLLDDSVSEVADQWAVVKERADEECDVS